MLNLPVSAKREKISFPTWKKRKGQLEGKGGEKEGGGQEEEDDINIMDITPDGRNDRKEKWNQISLLLLLVLRGEGTLLLQVIGRWSHYFHLR